MNHVRKYSRIRIKLHMKKTVKDKILNKLLKLGKKYRFLKTLMVVCISVVLGIYNIVLIISGNTKKIVSFACLALFFMVSSSFASIGFIQTSDFTDKTIITDNAINAEIATAEVALTASVTEDETIDIIEDNDVIDGYEDSNLDNIKTDFYSVDEILGENEVVKTMHESEKTELDKNDWRLLLINKQHPVPDDYEFTLGTIKGNMKCDKRIIDDLLQMLQGAKKDGVNLVIISPYRDMNRQEVLFNRKIAAYMKKGMSYMVAYKITSQTVTVPGASEHQIGLALDIICDSYSSLDAEFGETEAGKWLAEHSCEYGFILRYPKGKEYITSIEYEPWHFRYVGKEAATQITEEEITLEEFVENL